MRIALAQINTIVGDVPGNAALIRDAVRRVREESQSVDVVLFPEMSMLGYPPRDLIFKHHLIEQCESTVAALASELTTPDDDSLLLIIPSPRHNNASTGTGVCNSLALCRGGSIVSWYDKRLLPTYDVFDEKRYFDPGLEPGVIIHAGQRIGLTICEDLWIDDVQQDRPRYRVDPIDDLAQIGVDLIINASASPYRTGVREHRRSLFQKAAIQINAPLVFTNLVGGNDDLIFDGHSGLIVPNQDGYVQELAGYATGLEIVDTNRPNHMADQCDSAPEEDATSLMHDVFYALTLGVRDYVRKCGFSDVWIALSGGIDSALVAAIAVSALGTDHVRGVGLPSRYSSAGSVDDAHDLADRLGIRMDVLPIESAHCALAETVQPLFDELDVQPGVAEENIQARIRGNIMMALSNKFGALLLTTGNKSEIAVGYCTLYGDMAGGLSVISDVPKTMVYELSRWINDHSSSLGYACAPIPENTITKPPSAELRPNQTDQDSLPEYDVLDAIIQRYVEESRSAKQIIQETGIDPEIVKWACRLIDRNEYKRRQMATGLKITGRAFGTGWRMPIAARIPND